MGWSVMKWNELEWKRVDEIKGKRMYLGQRESNKVYEILGKRMREAKEDLKGRERE